MDFFNPRHLLMVIYWQCMFGMLRNLVNVFGLHNDVKAASLQCESRALFFLKVRTKTCQRFNINTWMGKINFVVFY